MAQTAAEALQRQLQSQGQGATLLKLMSSSHVSGGFWLGGFREWRDEVLPQHTCDLALEHRGAHWPVRYLINNPGLSGGWRTFAIDHKLLEGDYVLFHKRQGLVIKVYLFRAADYKDGKEPEESAYFEDAATVNFMGRKVASVLKQSPTLVNKKRSVHEAKADAPEQDVPAVTTKKPRAGTSKAAARPDAGAGPSSPRGAVPVAARDVQGVEGAAAAGDADAEVEVVASVPGSDQKGRRNPGRSSKPAPGALKIKSQPLALVVEGAVKRQKKTAAASAAQPGAADPSDPDAPAPAPAKKKRAPKDPNAPPKPRAPRKPKDPNAPTKKRAAQPKKPKKVSYWQYQYPEGKISDLAAVLKARHAEVCKDGIRVDKKSGTILEDFIPNMRPNGFTAIAWMWEEKQYRPIHSLFDRARDGLRDNKCVS